MATRELTGAPRILPLYARAAAPMVPLASRLPFVPGGGKDVPDTELVLRGVRTDAAALAQYARVCGFGLRATVPVTWPHVQAFPLHMALMAASDFPFGAVGLVHVANRIEQHRGIRTDERLDLAVRGTKLAPHAAGRTFDVVTEARVGDELVWEETSTFLRRGGGTGERGARESEPELPETAVWKLGGDLGRRYAAASGDRNPIHLHDLSAKLLGFPRAIAHGMWTKARCLAALEGRLGDAVVAEVRFRKPVLLPAKVAFLAAAQGDDAWAFAVRDARKGTPHVTGTLTSR